MNPETIESLYVIARWLGFGFISTVLFGVALFAIGKKG